MNNTSYKSNHRFRKKSNGYKNKNKFNNENNDNKKTQKKKKGNGGYGRPGPFGFKRRPIDEEQQIIANPFGFASHNKVTYDEDEKKDEKKEPTLTLPVIDEEEKK